MKNKFLKILTILTISSSALFASNVKYNCILYGVKLSAKPNSSTKPVILPKSKWQKSGFILDKNIIISADEHYKKTKGTKNFYIYKSISNKIPMDIYLPKESIDKTKKTLNIKLYLKKENNTVLGKCFKKN